MVTGPPPATAAGRADIRALYAEHFGLREPPFALTPDPRYLFLGERHREALAHLLFGVQEGGSVVVLTGEVGTGKTTLCRALLEQLPPEVDVALIVNPRLTARELLAAVCEELRLSVPREGGLKPLVDALHRYLLEAHARGRRTVLLVDEAQHLGPDALEQIRLLTNLETARDKLLQVVLVGQPELARLLGRPRLRQLAQRVTARYHLEPFTAAETRAYVRHRLAVAGRKGSLFTEAALRAVHRAAGGIPRVVNAVCDRALMGAYARDLDRVTARTVRRAAAEVRGPRPWPWRTLRPVAAGLVLLLGGVGAAYLARSLPGLAGTPASRDPVLPDLPAASAPPAIEPRLPAPGAGPALPLPPREAMAPPLAAILADPAVPADRWTAFLQLYARWGVEAPSGAPRAGCEQARRYGLACLFRAGSWRKLRRFGLPAILELVAPDGQRRHATLVALDDQRATLAFGPRRLTYPLQEIDPAWDGSFILLWRPPPALATVPLRPGARGPDVIWLRGQLAALAGTAPEPGDVYDDRLLGQVVAFQRARGLLPDGVVAEETLTELARALGEPGLPALARPGP